MEIGVRVALEIEAMRRGGYSVHTNVAHPIRHLPRPCKLLISHPCLLRDYHNTRIRQVVLPRIFISKSRGVHFEKTSIFFFDVIYQKADDVNLIGNDIRTI